MARHEKGQILLLTLIILTIGAIIMGSLLIYLNTSMSASEKSEERAMTYYAADSGFEDGYFWLQQGGNLTGWNNAGGKHNYYISDHKVDVIVEEQPTGNDIYKITSTATYNKSDESTVVESYVRASPIKFWEFGQDAISSNCSVRILGEQSFIDGNVTYVCNNELNCPNDPCPPNPQPGDPPCCHILPPFGPHPDPDGIDWWPETWAITQYFKDEAENQGAVHLTGDVLIDITDPSYAPLGPLYVDGNLDIYSSIGNASTSLVGIVYVTGDLTIDGNRDFTLDLNNQVIFVENKDAIIGGSNYNQPFAEVVIYDYCTFTGSGAIFAIGDIYFAPKMSTSPQEFLFVMSLEGWVNMQPTGVFYGSIAGNLHVDISPNSKITRTDGDDLWDTFFDPEPVISEILTYNIIDS